MSRPDDINFTAHMNTTHRLIALDAKLTRAVEFRARPQEDEPSTMSKIAKGAAALGGLGGLAYGGAALGRGALSRAARKSGWKGVWSDLKKNPLTAAKNMTVAGARMNNRSLVDAYYGNQQLTSALRTAMRKERQGAKAMAAVVADTDPMISHIRPGQPPVVPPDLDEVMAQYRAYQQTRGGR